MDLRIDTISPTAPLTRTALLARLRMTGVGLAEGLLLAPAAALFTLTLVSFPLLLAAGVGLAVATVAVPATARLTRAPRILASRILGEDLPAWYADTSGRNPLAVPAVWLRDEARWRDVAWLAFAATGGAVMSLLPTTLLTSWVAWLVVLLTGSSWGVALAVLVLSGPMVLAWWLVTPALIRARAVADRAILAAPRADELERRVSEVTASRSASLDHSAAEVRRIERDLHDGAQARIVSVGINLGLAEQLMPSDPDGAAALLREARESTVTALGDLRTVVRGIHPPVLADRGLVGGVEALAADLPLPVTLVAEPVADLPPPLESAAYFAVAELLANVVKHAGAGRAWVRLERREAALHLEVGDDGVGGADQAGSGIDGVARRVAAFDGTMVMRSPQGGPTVVTVELPCG